MTTPPFNPPSNDPGGSGDATQPVPTPPAQPTYAYPPGAAYPPGGAYPPGSTIPGARQPDPGSGPGVFQPASPEPGPFQPVPPEGGGPMLVPPQAVRGSSGSSRMLNVALAAAVLIATAGVAFAVGRTTAPAAASSTNRFANGFGGNGPNASFDVNGRGFPNASGAPDGGFRGGAFGGGFGGGLTIEGTVQSVTADSVTITTANGATITLGLSSSTTYHQQADATAGDVQSGKTVIVRVTGNGFRPGAENNGTGNGNGSGTTSLGTASDVTVVP